MFALTGVKRVELICALLKVSPAKQINQIVVDAYSVAVASRIRVSLTIIYLPSAWGVDLSIALHDLPLNGVRDTLDHVIFFLSILT